MTPDELGQRLKAIDHNEHLRFLHKFADKREVPKDFVEYLVEHPEDERLLAHLVGLPTEEERHTHAAVSSARSAKISALWAAICTLIAIISLTLTIMQSCSSKETSPAQQSPPAYSMKVADGLPGNVEE